MSETSIDFIDTKHIKKFINFQSGDLIMTEYGGDWLLVYDKERDYFNYKAINIKANTSLEELNDDLLSNSISNMVKSLDDEYTVLEYQSKDDWHVILEEKDDYYDNASW